MNRVWTNVGNYMGNHVGQLEHIGWDIVKIIVLILVAQIVVRILSRVAHRVVHLRTKIDIRRKNTLEGLFQNVIKYTIYFILLLTILPIVGVHIEALLAGAGVAGIAIAFGAQSLLKDLFNGMFVLFEDQYGVGDYVDLGGVVGEVRLIGLRITVLKVWTGELVTIPNGQILQVTNYSKENSIAVIDINVGFQTPVEDAAAIITRVLNKYRPSEPNIVDDPVLLGVQSLNDSTYTLRATVECKPYMQFGVTRTAKQLIHQEFQASGIDLPLQKVVYMPGKSSTQQMSPPQGADDSSSAK